MSRLRRPETEDELGKEGGLPFVSRPYQAGKTSHTVLRNFNSILWALEIVNRMVKR